MFVRHAKYYDKPFIPFELIWGRGFGVMNLINLCSGATTIGFGALVPLYAQQRFDITALEASTLLSARAVGSICVAALAVYSLRRTGHRLPMLVGLSLTAVGFAAMSAPQGSLSVYWWLSIAAGVTGIGMGMTLPAANNAALQLAPDQAASIAGLRGMFRQGGAIIAISLATAILARSQHPGAVEADIFLAFAGLLVLALPLLLLVPDHRGRW
jgi:MFS family permease